MSPLPYYPRPLPRAAALSTYRQSGCVNSPWRRNARSRFVTEGGQGQRWASGNMNRVGRRFTFSVRVAKDILL